MQRSRTTELKTRSLTRNQLELAQGERGRDGDDKVGELEREAGSETARRKWRRSDAFGPFPQLLAQRSCAFSAPHAEGLFAGWSHDLDSEGDKALARRP
ncbi:hypothetical protein TARUN_4210 [Trichoderma arundinaceum]|uniref:Uncharacterized protein n=1 Tax=Trichoderma arundinaceum TaxID=490622 RepID=A0A395NQ00_TRIAR|nr:hypothetical protein TARUN_4210 [Trichoderma arundinaceum]